MSYREAVIFATGCVCVALLCDLVFTRLISWHIALTWRELALLWWWSVIGHSAGQKFVMRVAS